MMTCQIEKMNSGGPYPRSCPECKLGPCKHGLKIKPELVSVLSKANRKAGIQADLTTWFHRLPLDEQEEILKDVKQRVWSQQYGENRDDG